ncbi:hypothetical protein SNE40_013438 [Patella caerulea]|uniref:G-protein coupled receptors family 3 profile domain-containing protein n=1 Tax=Patella caerulea TaxID=87958 RepID=A0AAN8JBL1_PATCE
MPGIVLYVIVATCGCSFALPPTPIFQQDGDIDIVCLFDIHERQTQGKCEDFNSVTMEMAYTALWKWQELNKTSSITSIGLRVYDLCGSDKIAIEILSEYINNNNNRLGGVISYTGKEPTNVISEMLRHLYVPHVKFTSDVMTNIDDVFDNRMTVSLALERRVEAAVDALGVLNWTYVDVVTLNNTGAISEQDYFLQLLKPTKVCVHQHQILNPDSLETLQLPRSVPKGIILFTGDVLTRRMFTNMEKSSFNKVLIVGGISDVDLSQKLFSKDLVILVEHFTEIQQLSDFIAQQQSRLNNSANRAELFLSDFECDVNITAGANMTPESCALPSMTSRSLHATSDSVSTMFKLLVTLVTTNCTRDIKSCLPISVRDLLQYHRNGGQSEEWKPYLELVSLSNGPVKKVFDIAADLSQLYGNVKVEGHLPEVMYTSNCKENCLTCSVCSARYRSNEQIVIQPADIFIVGTFPIYTSTSVGTCATANPPGLQAARAFLSAIDSFKNRYNDTISLQNITIGGVVFDSCSHFKNPDVRVTDIESCIYDYQDASGSRVNLPPVRTAAYFHFHENIDHVTTVQSNPKLSTSVSSLGLGLERHVYKHYSDALTKVLHKIKWTYFKIIHSTNTALRQLVNEFIANTDIGDLCIADVIEIGPGVDDYLPQATLLNKDGVGTLLFTTVDDTAKILDSIQSLNNSAIKQKLFIFPWNIQALIDIKRPEFLENALLLRPKNWPITVIDDTLNDDVIPWLPDFDSKSNLTLSKEMESSVIVGVDLLLSTINAVYRELCTKQNGVCGEFSDYRDLKPRLESTFEMLLSGMESPFEIHDYRMVGDLLDTVQIGKIEIGGDVTLALSLADNTRGTMVDIAPSTCTAWCPKCYTCKNGQTSVKDLLYLPGDILITGVLPVHVTGTSSFECGDMSEDAFISQSVEAFMYAVESSQTRYPYLLNNVKIGAVILDYCSNPYKAIQMVGNYESCGILFNETESLPPSPRTNLGYVVHGDNHTLDPVAESIKDLNKLVVTTYKSPIDAGLISGDAGNVPKSAAIVDLLLKLNWTYIYLVTSDSDVYKGAADTFIKIASNRGVCVGKILGLDNSVKSIVEISQYIESSAKAVVMITSRMSVKLFYTSRDQRSTARPWIIDITGDDWNSDDLSDLQLPQGSILIDKQGKSNSGFENYMSKFNISLPEVNVWWRTYWSFKYGCRQSEEDGSGESICDFTVQPYKDRPFSPQAARIIRSVDIALHAIHSQYLQSCPLMPGVCSNFVKSGMSAIPADVADVYFQDGDERIEFVEEGQLVQKYLIKTFSSNQQFEVGVWRDGVITLQGSFFKYFPSSYCGKNCQCENTIHFTNTTAAPTENRSKYIYWKTTGVFNGRLWATVLVAIAATGAFVSLILTVYVVHKVCNRTLARRYVGLGILLLLGVMLLFFSVVPFVITPSEATCGFRYVMPGCAYAFSFAIILVKLTSLRDYRLLGLGGEVSNLNQYMFVLFITGVQVAIAVQWWTLRSPLVITSTSNVGVMYACVFDQAEFVLHHSYVMMLIVTSAIYAISVRQETKNMGEARLLLWCCWLCVPVWIVWVIVFLIQDRDYSEPTACVAIVSCATLMLTVIFIPKIHMVAKIKYSISKGSKSFHNGYKLDAEFLYERPYSLPGTLTTNYSTMKTHPRSISNFDASLSY